MYTSAIRTGMKYLAASMVIAAAAAVYGLFSHGVCSYYMTYAFMIPLLGGALPHLIAAMKGAESSECGERAFRADIPGQGEAAACASDKQSAVKSYYENEEASPQTVTAAENDVQPDIPASHFSAKDMQLAIIATLTAGSLLKGALDIYGTTNRLLIAYPVIAAMMLAAALASMMKHGVRIPVRMKNK